jgi:hypothetical protein
MAPAGTFYDFLMAPRPKPQAPPYNKVAKYPVMTVEVETVLLREPSGRPAKKKGKYPYYPVLERTVERVDSSSEEGRSGRSGDGGDASSSAASSSSDSSSAAMSFSSLTGWFSSGSSA